MNKIIITEGKAKIEGKVCYEDLLLQCTAVIGQYAVNLINSQPTQKQKEECEAELFDFTNIAFSAVLERSFPNQTLRPDLTEEAIMLAENQLLKERLLKQNQKENNNEV